MTMDYRELCIELFGTDNVAQLRKIAEKASQKNPRNAGRKKRFSAAEIADIELLRNEGVTLNEIARNYHTSRQVIGRYLSPKPREGCPLRMTYMFRQHPCTVIDLDFLNRRVFIENKTNDLLHRAFGVNEHPSWDDFEVFLQDRCFPKSRGNCRQILSEMGLTDYDPLQIVEKTQGRISEDNLWIKVQYYPKEAAAHEAH